MVKELRFEVNKNSLKDVKWAVKNRTLGIEISDNRYVGIHFIKNPLDYYSIAFKKRVDQDILGIGIDGNKIVIRLGAEASKLNITEIISLIVAFIALAISIVFPGISWPIVLPIFLISMYIFLKSIGSPRVPDIIEF